MAHNIDAVAVAVALCDSPHGNFLYTRPSVFLSPLGQAHLLKLIIMILFSFSEVNIVWTNNYSGDVVLACKLHMLIIAIVYEGEEELPISLKSILMMWFLLANCKL